METFDAGRLFIAVTGLSNLAHNLTGWNGIAIPTENHQSIKDKIDFVCAELERVGLVNSLVSARQLHKIIHNEAIAGTTEPLPPGNWMVLPHLAAGRYQNFSKELVNRLRDELSAKVVMILPNDKMDYFNKSDGVFSIAVRNKFSATQQDMAEAAKCFALGRYTACVFHLMRIMESALQSFGTKLGIALTNQKSWQNILDEVNKAIKNLSPKDPDRKRYASISALLYNVKLAWRNEVMHPKETYSEEDAERIFSAVRSFLDDLASLI